MRVAGASGPDPALQGTLWLLSIQQERSLVGHITLALCESICSQEITFVASMLLGEGGQELIRFTGVDVKERSGRTGYCPNKSSYWKRMFSTHKKASWEGNVRSDWLMSGLILGKADLKARLGDQQSSPTKVSSKGIQNQSSSVACCYRPIFK